MTSVAKSLVNCGSGGLQQQHAHPTAGGTGRSWLAGTNSHRPWWLLGITSGLPSGRPSSAGRSPDATSYQYQGAEEIVCNHPGCSGPTRDTRPSTDDPGHPQMAWVPGWPRTRCINRSFGVSGRGVLY